jgi:hypothetical protein
MLSIMLELKNQVTLLASKLSESKLRAIILTLLVNMSLLIFPFFLSDKQLGKWVYVFQKINPLIILATGFGVSLLAIIIYIGLQSNRLNKIWLTKVVGIWIISTIKIIQSLAIKSVGLNTDSPAYLGGDGLSFFLTRSLWVNSRPITLPFFYTFLKNDLYLIGWFQLLVSISSWGVFAWVISRQIKNSNIERIVFLLLLLLSLDQQINIWDWIILSESLAISFGLLFVSTLLLYFKDQNLKTTFLVIITGFFWSQTRDTNIYILLMVGGIVSVYGIVRSRSMTIFAILFFIISVFFYTRYSIEQSQRYLPVYLNNITLRVLPNNEFYQYFYSMGMPVDEETRARWRDKLPDLDVYYDSIVPAFPNWVEENWSSSFSKWLIRFPFYTISAPFFQDEFPPRDSFIWFKSPGYHAVIPYFFTGNHMTRPIIWSLAWICLSTITILVLGIQFQKRNLSLFFIGLILLGYVNALLSWHGDVLETARHTVPAGVQLKTGLIAGLAFILDTYITSQRIR